jgi:hypothetical protein
MKRITCRVHGGTFVIEPKRGRPPVKCNDDNPCSALTGNRKVPAQKGSPAARTRAQVVDAGVAANRRKASPLPQALQAPVKPPQSVPEPLPEVPASVAKALETKALLEPQGWTCHAKRTGDGKGVEFHASRGIERIAIVISTNGTVVFQEYTLWDTQKPSTNEMPPGARKLPFNPDEMTDKELVSMLKERTVVWWNRISKKEESATIPAKVQVTHTFNGHDDEVPADRVITFVDMMGGGFRTFRQGALMRLDK